MIAVSSPHFDRQYRRHLKQLKLKDLQPKAIEAYSRSICRIGKRYDGRIDDPAEPQLADYLIERRVFAFMECGEARSVRAEVLPFTRTVEALTTMVMPIAWSDGQLIEFEGPVQHAHG